VRDGNFLAVAAPTSALAAKAAASIRAEWKSEPQPSSKELFDYVKKNQLPREEQNENEYHIAGNVERVFASSEHRLTSSYNIHYIAHAPLEPRSGRSGCAGNLPARFTFRRKKCGC
jgi:nicotinate dehydrogenase subunit B